MSDWPEGWAREPRKVPSGRPDDATQVVPPAAANRPADTQRMSGLPVSTQPTTTPRQPAPPPGPPGPPPTGRRRGRPTWVRWTLRIALVLVILVALLFALIMYFFSKVEKVDAISDYRGRPAATPGQDWLMVGSDSREGLSNREVKQLHLGKVAGRRTDTIMLLHIPSGGGKPTLVSLPRDSYVPIPGHGSNKLNAAYALGGPKLLVRTVEQVTGIRIDHYAEIGFGGFVGMTDAVGGVELCPKQRIRDPKSGLRVRKGCQDMDGATSLAYVRARYFDPQGDLGRVKRQQEYLAAIFHEATKPTTVLNPFAVVRLGNASTKSLTVDEDDGPIDLLRLGFGMRAVAGGDGRKVTVPIADPNYQTAAGSSVKWDTERALRLFRNLRQQ